MPRNLLPTMFGLLLALPGAALAQDGNETATHDDARIQPARDDTFALRIDPPEARLPPGGEMTFTVLAKSRVEQALHLRVEARDADGFRYGLADETLRVAPGHPARTTLVVHAPDASTRGAHGFATFVVIAESESGETRRAAAKVGVGPKPGEHGSGEYGFAIHMEANVRDLKPGDEFPIQIVAKARQPMTLNLRAEARGEGAKATVEPATLTLAPGSPGHAAIIVRAPDREGPFGVKVTATSESGHVQTLHARFYAGACAVVVDADIAARGVAADAFACAKRDDGQLMERIRHLESRVREMEIREKELRAQLRIKEAMIERLLREREERNATATAEGYALVETSAGVVPVGLDEKPSDARPLHIQIRPGAYGGWRAHVSDAEGRPFGGHARLFLLMELAGAHGPGGW